ncbi:ribosomal L7Ae/L30e/S12e/Gadd45 family protein [Paenibacillus sp. D51F]
MAYKIGTKQTTKTVESGKAIHVYVARDADDRLTGAIVELCGRMSVPVTWTETMTDLGEQCGIEVGAAMAAMVGDEE